MSSIPVDLRVATVLMKAKLSLYLKGVARGEHIFQNTKLG
jgi:hypothetical protein